MRCSQVQHSLSDPLFLSTRDDESLQEHLSHCPSCADVATEKAGLSSLLESYAARPLHAPDDLRARIHQSLDQSPSPPTSRRSWLLTPPFLQRALVPALALALLAITVRTIPQSLFDTDPRVVPSLDIAGELGPITDHDVEESHTLFTLDPVLSLLPEDSSVANAEWTLALFPESSSEDVVAASLSYLEERGGTTLLPSDGIDSQ